MDVLVFYSPTKVKIVRPAPGVSLDQARQDLYRDGIVATPETPWLVVDDATLPDRTQRAQWRVRDGRVVIA